MKLVDVKKNGAVAMRALRVPVWDCHAFRARLEILVSFPIPPDDAGTGVFQTAPNCVVGFRFRLQTSSDVHFLFGRGIELARVAHGTTCRYAVWNALGAVQALTPPRFGKMTVKFHWDSKSVEARRDGVRSLFVFWVNSYTRTGGESFGFESRVSRVDFSPTASGGPWMNPTATQVGPSDGSRLPAKTTAVPVAARSVFAVEDVVRPTVSQTSLTGVAEHAFRRC